MTFVDWADVTRWKVINKQLDLPFDEVLETYSTSEHFFHDMGIAPGTKGRLVPEKPAEPRASSSEGGRSGGRADSGDRPAEDRPRRNRSRTRTRSGEPVDAGSAPATAPAGSEGDSESKPSGSRNRRRRRRSSGSGSKAATSSE